MTTKRKMAFKTAPLTYAELGKTKPINNELWHRKPMPIRIVTCFKCHHRGGTFVNIGTHKEPKYIHSKCQSAS